jgi:hypothetical protein
VQVRAERRGDRRGGARRARSTLSLARARTVLPEPLLPTMSVSGLRNAMTCGSSGEKLRMPWICSLLMVLIFSLRPGRRLGWAVRRAGGNRLGLPAR